jgi:hypothetical protein
MFGIIARYNGLLRLLHRAYLLGFSLITKIHTFLIGYLKNTAKSCSMTNMQLIISNVLKRLFF